MRTPIGRVAALVISLTLAACSSGTVIVVRQPAPPPPPPRPRIAPLEVTLARPIRGQLLVQTNRPSYVALFEIVPGRGVALLAPAYPHQRTWMLAGLNWVPVSWKVQSTLYYGRPSGTSVPARWVYAIASDEPLHIPDEAFHPSYMRRALGLAAYRATNPHLTMRAIARAFVPSVVDEAWAEDAYALPATYASDPYRTVRIYCANRTVYEVPEEVADRAWCPIVNSGATVVRTTPARPDSVVASNGRRIRIRMPETTPVRVPIGRVPVPPASVDAPVADEREAARNDDNAQRPKEVKDDAKTGRGNAYGHTDDPNVKGRGIENEKRDDPRRTPRVDTSARTNAPQSQPDRVEQRNEREQEKEIRAEQREERKADKIERREEKVEQRVEEKADRAEQKVERAEQKVERAEQKVERVEQKVDVPAATPEPEPDAPAVKAEPEAKPEKPETKAEKAEAKPEKAEAKPEDKSAGKPDEDPAGKPEDKGNGKPDEPGKKGNKNKP
ncbi:MAG TPA: hypothetical protein VFU01_06565 [Gemmatimonadaceae bacterium]|nr:hypothetical protein [Gemmatimonadaceae bacterium]